MSATIGIDLGTSISVVARVTDRGAVEIVRNAVGEILTPSVVHFASPTEVVVGAEAKAAGILDVERVVVAVKRRMGTDLTYDIDGASYRPEAVSALVLRALAQAAASELGVAERELRAVVTVPAYFGTAEREATAMAARIAGLEVLDLVAEPVAAALAYGIGAEEHGSALVYDLGGGTFDATVIRLTPQGPRVVAVDGAPQLGGLSFDERLASLLLERYVAATGDEDAWDDEDFVVRVHAEAEAAKKRLTRTMQASAPLHRAGASASINVTRDEFEIATCVLVDESLAVVDRVIASAAALGASPPRVVLLTGGSTRMPAIATALGRHIGVEVRLVDPDTAVAAGAAIHCAALVARTQAERPRIAAGPGARVLESTPVRSVVPRAIGLKIHDSGDPSGTRVIVQHVIAANEPLPVEASTATFSTVVDGQERVRVEVMEQAGSVAGETLEANRRILDGELTGLSADLPAGSPIELTLSMGADGRLTCVAREPRSGKALVLESYMVGVADGAEFVEQRRMVSGLLVRD